MDRLDRRRFLQQGLTVAGGLAAPWIIPARARGTAEGAAAGERLGIGLIGCGLMGAGHRRRMLGDPAVQVRAVCDPDGVRCQRAQAEVQQHYGQQDCAAYADYRELLARADIDAVIIATPDHWHALQSIDAAKAGKDVYCEKPISLTIAEGRRLAETMARYGRIFQTGTQYRSGTQIRRVCQFVRQGGLGKIKAAFTILSRLGGFIGGGRFQPYLPLMDLPHTAGSFTALSFALPAEPVPAGLDWELWVGPAPWRPYNSLYHTNAIETGVVPWSFDEDFGAASLTWHLSHSMDVLQYGLGTERTGPVEIIHPDTGEFPTLTCRYATGALLHFVEAWDQIPKLYGAVPADARLAGLFGGVFVGERGWITSMSTGGPIEGGPPEIFHELGLESREVNHGGNNHHANWLECIRTRQPPSTDEELGHRTASVGHLAEITCRLGRSLRWDPEKEEFPGDGQANRLRSRAMRPPWCM